MTTKSITTTLVFMKDTKNRYKYGDDHWKLGRVCGSLYPLQEVLLEAFGKVPKELKITIEEVG